MKKKMTLIAFAVLWISIFSLQAGVRIGVKGGVNLANAAFNIDAVQTDNFTGFQIGPIVEISGLPLFNVDAAILYSQHGIKFKADTPSLSASSYRREMEYEEKVSTLDIPANLKLKFSVADQAGIYLSAGPYISFKIDSQTTFDKIKQDWGSKNFGVGLNFGAGVELVRHLQLGVNYQLALNDDYNNFAANWSSDFKDLAGKTRIWSITAAYFF